MKEGGFTAIAMNPTTIVPREQVALHLTVSLRTLHRLEQRGLVKAIEVQGVEGYGPDEIRRLWTIVSFRRDLGVNMAGVEVILRLRDQLDQARLSVRELSRFLEAGGLGQHSAVVDADD